MKLRELISKTTISMVVLSLLIFSTSNCKAAETMNYYSMVKNNILQSKTYDEFYDVNDDGVVNVFDAIRINQNECHEDLKKELSDLKKEFTDLKSDLNNFIGVDVKTLSPAYFGNFYNANGEIKTSAYWSATYIEDIDYDKIEYFAYTNTTSYYAVAFYSSGVARDSDFISGITYNVADVKDKITIRRADIPKNAKIIVFFNRSYSGTDVSVTGYKTTISSDVKNLVNLFDWKSESNLLNNYTSVTGKYVSYSNGAIGTNPDYEYYVIPVTQGKKYKLNKKDHIAFFSSSTITQSNYISGLMCNKLEEINVPSGATHVTVSVPISFKSWFNYSDVDYIENTTIKTECLPNNRIIVGGSDGSYTNIVRAVLDAKVGTEIIVRSGTYDLEAQFKAVYGNDFFDNYQGYTSTNNYDLSGLYLKKGVKLIADGGVVLSFMYSGSNAKVSEEFSPINMTIDNVVDGVIIKINANARYHIHDDFAFHAFMNINNYGSNEIKNCVFLGNPTKGASIGGGMGTYCKYYIHDNRFENTIGDAITYHNSSFGDAQNFIDVYNNYCITGIKIWWYGASKKITTALVHNNYASDIVCEKLPNFDAPNVNVEMKAWNNVTN